MTKEELLLSALVRSDPFRPVDHWGILIRSLKPGDRVLRSFDGGGLYLEVKPIGAKGWRLKYRFQGKEKRLSLGVYPEVSLKAASAARETARLTLASGVDPSAERKAAKVAHLISTGNSFEVVAREWVEQQSSAWVPAHVERVVSLLERDLFPQPGSRPIAEIDAPELLKIVRRAETRTVERAHRALGTAGQIFRYAVASGRAASNPAGDLRGALQTYRSKNFAAPTDPKTFAPLLRDLYGYEGTATVAAALRLAPLVFVRPEELRKAEWADVDLETGEWRYTSSKTKQPHIVPLARQGDRDLRRASAAHGQGQVRLSLRNERQAADERQRHAEGDAQNVHYEGSANEPRTTRHGAPSWMRFWAPVRTSSSTSWPTS